MRSCPACQCRDGIGVISLDNNTIVECAVCRFVYVNNPRKEDTVIHRVCKVAPIMPPVRMRHRQIKQYIENRSAGKCNVSIAEIGAGLGGLASLFSQNERYRYVGYEPNIERAEFCRRFNLSVVNGFYRPGISKYDYVVLDNALEHVLNPNELLQEVSDDLKPGGCAIIIVPNLHDVRRHIPSWRTRHYWQPRSHVNYFSRFTLFKMLQSVGLSAKMLGFSGLSLTTTPSFYLRAFFDVLKLPLLGLTVVAAKPE